MPGNAAVAMYLSLAFLLKTERLCLHKAFAIYNVLFI